MSVPLLKYKIFYKIHAQKIIMNKFALPDILQHTFVSSLNKQNILIPVIVQMIKLNLVIKLVRWEKLNNEFTWVQLHTQNTHNILVYLKRVYTSNILVLQTI